MRLRRLIPWAVLVTVLAVAPAARAQPNLAEERGRARFEEGIERFNLGDLQGALAQFQSAYELTQSPVVLYNIGLVQAQLGHPVEAVDALRRVIASPGPLAPERLERARATERAQAAHVGELSVTGAPGAAIEIDGAEVARTPLAAPLWIKEGTHRVGLVAERFAPSRKDVLIVPGRRTDIAFDLVPIDKRLAHVAFRTQLPGALVLLDGQAVGETPLSAPFAVAPGRHRLDVRRFGYVPLGSDFVVDEGATAELALEPVEDEGVVRTHGGELALDLSEKDVVVTVDGRVRGTYASPLVLAPGRHEIRLERGGFFAERRLVEVPARAALAARIRFEPTAQYRADYVDRAKAFRRWGWVGAASGAALLGFGVGFTIWNTGRISSAQNAIDDFNARAKQGGNGECDPLRPDFDEQACSSRQLALNDAIDTAKGRVWIGVVGIVVGAAAGGLGVTLLAVGDDPDRYQRRPSGERLGLRLRPEVAFTKDGAFIAVRSAF